MTEGQPYQQTSRTRRKERIVMPGASARCARCLAFKWSNERAAEAVSALLDAALDLEAWLSEKVGDTADWPVHLHVDNRGDAIELAALLAALTAAAQGYRRKNEKAPQ